MVTDDYMVELDSVADGEEFVDSIADGEQFTWRGPSQQWTYQ